MVIKVCGLKDPENIAAVAALGANYLGFICYEPSPRYIDQLPVEVVNNVPENVKKTGVFVNENAQNIEFFINKYRLHRPGIVRRFFWKMKEIIERALWRSK